MHFPTVRHSKCAVRVFSVPSDKAGNKKDRLKALLHGFFRVSTRLKCVCPSCLFFFLFPLCLWREPPPWTEEKRPGFRLLSQLNRWPFDSPPLSSSPCFFLVFGPDPPPDLLLVTRLASSSSSSSFSAPCWRCAKTELSHRTAHSFQRSRTANQRSSLPLY